MLNDYPQILNKIRNTPWCITEEGLKVILAIVDERLAGVKISQEEIQYRLQGTSRGRASNAQQIKGVGLLPIHGPIFGKANMMTQLSGASSVETMQQDFRALMQNDQVQSILLDVDSPGGVSDLILEFGEEIREARDEKPIYAVANVSAYSAGYWLASQASKLFATPSGGVGSVGVYAVHENDDRKVKEDGIDRTIIEATGSPKKAELGKPLTDEAKSWIQGRLDETYEQFVGAVAAGRKTTVDNVRANYGEGRMVSAKDALRLGMVDGVETFDTVLASALEGGGGVIEAPKPQYFAKGTSLNQKTSYDKELEHSEPGSGSGGAPEPRIAPEDEHIDNWKENGGRLQRPPNIPELEDEVMNREELEIWAGKLGIDHEGLSDEELKSKVSAELDATIETSLELKDATANASQHVEFTKQFPEEAEQLRKLQEGNQKHEAASFAKSLTDIEVTTGEGEAAKTSNFRLSALAQEALEGTHLKLAQGNLVQSDLADLVRKVAVGTVPQGEMGSSRKDENSDYEETVPNGVKEVRSAFNDKVVELMKDDNLDRKAAMDEAAKRYPALAAAYMQKS